MFRIKDALALAKSKGLIRKNSELANTLWSDSSPKSAYMNLRNLVEGNSKKINIADVPIICKTCGVSADYLFGLSAAPNMEEHKGAVIMKAHEIIETINQI